MSMRVVLFALVTLALLALTDAYPAAAQSQDCGSACNACPGEGFEGSSFAGPDGIYDMTCYPNIPFCVGCRIEHELVSGSDGVLREVAKASAEQLQELVREHHENLLYSRTRNMLVLKGSSCDTNAFDAVLFLPPEVAGRLEHLELASFEHHITKRMVVVRSEH